jgi:hypothetical protein
VNSNCLRYDEAHEVYSRPDNDAKNRKCRNSPLDCGKFWGVSKPELVERKKTKPSGTSNTSEARAKT